MQKKSLSWLEKKKKVKTQTWKQIFLFFGGLQAREWKKKEKFLAIFLAIFLVNLPFDNIVAEILLFVFFFVGWRKILFHAHFFQIFFDDFVCNDWSKAGWKKNIARFLKCLTNRRLISWLGSYSENYGIQFLSGKSGNFKMTKKKVARRKNWHLKYEKKKLKKSKNAKVKTGNKKC